MNKNVFHIGELSDLFNISVDSIRYYEKMGLLHPSRNENNRYREYSLDDFQTIVMIRELISLGFQMNQIRQFLTDRTVDTTIRMLEEEITIISSHIQELMQKKKNISKRIQALQQIQTFPHDETVFLKTFPARPAIMISRENLPDAYVDYSMVKYRKEHHKEINAIGFCDCYTLDLKNSNPDSDFYRTENVFFLSGSLSEKNDYFLPAGEYLCLFYQGSLRKTKLLLPRLFDYADAQKLTVTGHPIELCHIDGYETDDEKEYVIELELPVRPS